MLTLLFNFRRSLRPGFTIVLIPVIILLLLASTYLFRNTYQIRNTISYATRPLWDASTDPKEVIPHYYAEGLNIASEHTCRLHQWNVRKIPKEKVKVLDAVLMSSELDLLELRMNELDGVVDYFLIVESNATFTGLKKEVYFASNKERFSRFSDKIVYHLSVEILYGC